MSRDPFRDRWRRTQDQPRRAPKLERASHPLETLARGLGLRIETLDPLTSTLVATKQGVTLRIEPSLIHQSDWSITLRAAWLPTRVQLSPEGRLSALARVIGADDVQAGDSAFDTAVRVRGPVPEALVLLDHTTRNTLTGLAPRGFELRDGAFSMLRPRPDGEDAEHALRQELARAHGLVKRFASPLPLEVRLAERVTTDPSMLHRAECLAALAKLAPHFVQALAESGQLARWPALRLAACLLVDHLDDTFFRAAIVDAAIEPAARASALAKLARRHPPTALATIADRAMSADATPYLEEAALRVLRSAVATESKIVDTLSEASLLGLLRDAGGDDEVALVQRLEHVGTDAALEALLTRTSGLFVRAPLKRAARTAVAAIERRVGRDRGKLSLTAPAGGELSVPPSDRGAMSIADGAPGALTLDDE
ncbi:hypothetical protein L6R52_04410 [Myxococcota bacterium]|nr:hypothetical protein [Myxococcota bacterium]